MALVDKLKKEDFVIMAEMPTPKGVDISDFVAQVRHLKGRVDSVLIPDMNFAVMRLCALAGAVLVKDQGLDPVVQFSCRDRNRLALQGDLLGAHVLGIHNVMAVEGRSVEMGDHLDARPVHDLDVAGFLKAVSALSQGRDLGGKELKGAPTFCAGARIEPWTDASQMQSRLDAAKAAVEGGASFLVAPPVYQPEGLEAIIKNIDGLGAPVLASVMLLKSVGMARYLNQNMPGAKVAESTIQRIRQAADRPAECVKIAGETVAALRGQCQGVLLVAAGWEKRLPEVLDAAGL